MTDEGFLSFVLISDIPGSSVQLESMDEPHSYDGCSREFRRQFGEGGEKGASSCLHEPLAQRARIG